MKIAERYAGAVNATSLKSEPDTRMSNTDVLGAYGLASNIAPLGTALARMLAGGGPVEVIDVLEDMVMRKSKTLRIKISELMARDIATAVLSWYRNGTCQPCGGLGLRRIANTPMLGEECHHCLGTGKRLLHRDFEPRILPLAEYLSAQIERHQASAGVEAMRRLAPGLDL